MHNNRSDIFRVKEVLKDTMCICGGMTISLLQTGTPESVKKYTKKLIDVDGKDGGFIMGSSTVLDEAKPELVKVCFLLKRAVVEISGSPLNFLSLMQ